MRQTLSLEPRGLTQLDATRCLIDAGPNELPSSKPRGIAAIALDVVREPMLMLLVATGGLYVALGELRDAAAITVAVGLVLGLTLYQEQKTERTLDALRSMSSPRALVIRDGVEVRIPSREVVPGDLLALNEGDRVVADAIVASGLHLALDESMLTGESIPVPKQRRGSVFSGTLVVSGSGLARVTATGVATALGKIGASVAAIKPSKTHLQREVSRVVSILAVLGVATCVAVGVLVALMRHDWIAGTLAGLTTAISMIPEEFPVILTAFLALGAWRISKSRVLARRMPAVETLGAATVLCVDKTGTLTNNRMTVGTVHGDRTRVLETALLACPLRTVDPMELAFLDAAHADGVKPPASRKWTIIRAYPLSPAFLAVAQAWGVDGRTVAVGMKGAPETVVGACAMNGDERAALLRKAEELGHDGYRVLAVAESTATAEHLPETARDFSWTFVGLIGLIDPVRDGVPDAIAECRAAGIRVAMLTGDHPATALHVARAIGLRSTVCLTGADVSALDDRDLARQLSDVDVFARVMPDQKLRIVRGLQRAGEVVAMTGDGVNDAPSLKAAQIGIAMGNRGTDVAREAASLVLLDDNFISIVGAVRIGRRIYDNIRKAMGYVLAVHVPIAGVSLLPALLGYPLIILPLHLIFMEFIVDPACSVAFEMEPEEPDVMRRPPRRPDERMFDAHFVARSVLQGLGALAAAIGIFAAAVAAGLPEPTVRAMTFATLVFGNLALIFTNRSLSSTSLRRSLLPNTAVTALMSVTLMALSSVLFVPMLRSAFRVAAPTAGQVLVCLAAGGAVIAWNELVKVLHVH